MRYELIREIFNLCSNNQMRDVFVSEVETSDPEAVARTYCRGKDVTMDRTPLTQREIAAQCGISRSYVSRIEKRALQKLEDALTKET